MLRQLVERLQAGDLTVDEDSGRITDGSLSFDLYNPHPQSKYITAVACLTIDGQVVDLAGATLANPSVGEGHTDTPVAKLGPLSGFYVRRDQLMRITLPETRLEPGEYQVSGSFVLADVLNIAAAGSLTVR